MLPNAGFSIIAAATLASGLLPLGGQAQGLGDARVAPLRAQHFATRSFFTAWSTTNGGLPGAGKTNAAVPPQQPFQAQQKPTGAPMPAPATPTSESWQSSWARVVRESLSRAAAAAAAASSSSSSLTISATSTATDGGQHVFVTTVPGATVTRNANAASAPTMVPDHHDSPDADDGTGDAAPDSPRTQTVLGAGLGAGLGGAAVLLLVGFLVYRCSKKRQTTKRVGSPEPKGADLTAAAAAADEGSKGTPHGLTRATTNLSRSPPAVYEDFGGKFELPAEILTASEGQDCSSSRAAAAEDRTDENWAGSPGGVVELPAEPLLR